MKSRWCQSGLVGLRIVVLRPPDAARERARYPAGLIGCAEVVHQLLRAALEPIEVLLRQARANEAEAGHHRGQLALARGLTEGDGRNRPAVCGVLGLVEEDPRRPAVELLRHRAHLAGADDADEAGRLEHLEVMPDGALRNGELLRDL